MKIVVIGGSGLIGTKVVKMLTEQGHEALAASPSTGVDATTGRGLAGVLARAEVVVDVSNAPSFEDAAVLAFFEHSGRNLARGVLVEYGPGGSSPAHTHPNSAFIYATVLEGAIRSSINDRPVVTYRTGESFSEMPGDQHGVSENASKTEPAKLLAVFVVDADEKELTTPYEK
jgi:quercetin dioxygenase-like cupin family protein